jgi:hypothetical protein
MSRKMRCIGNVARIGERRNLKERDHLDKVGVDDRTILKENFEM